MPIPSLSSATKHRSQLARAADASSRSEPTPPVHASEAQSQPPNDQNSGDAAKRRSFLPQRGLLKSIARSGTTAEVQAPPTRPESHAAGPSEVSRGMAPEQTSVRDAKQGRLRPRSMYHTGVQAERGMPGTDGTAHSSRPAAVPSRPPNLAGPSRSQSLRRPGIAVQSAPVTRAHAHARTKSTSTVIGARQETIEANPTASRMERPKSLLMAHGNPKPSKNVPAEAAPGMTRTSARLDALKRSASTKAKPDPAHSTSDRTEEHSRSDEGCVASSTEPKKLARPAFSTLQQHFTPRKTGKPPTSTFLHPPSEPTNHALPPEIISLQNELLQLHLLHEPSAITLRQWELSAQKALRAKFDEVASLNQVMQENERFAQEQKNLLALREWNGDNSFSGLVEHIQALSGPLHELPSLLDPGGRFFLLAGDFDKWFSWVDEVWSDRNETSGHGSAMSSLEGLGDAWKGEHAAMTRKLTAFLRHLGCLPPTIGDSSIAHMVLRCQVLVDGLLAELQVMQAMENDIMTREKHWVEERLRGIAQDVEGRLETDKEAWRIY